MSLLVVFQIVFIHLHILYLQGSIAVRTTRSPLGEAPSTLPQTTARPLVERTARLASRPERYNEKRAHVPTRSYW